LTGKDITALHYSSPDRSLPTSQLDLAISNGHAQLSFWTYRQSDATSLTVYFSGNSNHERDVALRIAPRTGRVSLAKGDQWIDSEAVVPTQQWTRVTIHVDVDQRTYTASLGTESGPIHEPIPFAPPAERTVVHLGVNLPIKVPSYRIFNKVHFVPGEGCEESVYLDDVLVKWIPSLPDTPPARETLLDIDFESAAVGTTELGAVSELKIMPNAQSPEPFGIENTTSYGPGVRCLRARGGGGHRRGLPLEIVAGVVADHHGRLGSLYPVGSELSVPAAGPVDAIQPQRGHGARRNHHGESDGDD
jgi:hypothetical protein